MKKMLMLIVSCSLLIISCRHDDVYENSENTNQHADALKGKSFVLNQTELEAKYAGNKSLNTILQKEFKTEGLIKTNSVEGENGVYIDLDHIQVYESAQMHAITYYVEIGEQTETDEPQEMYNLMYFSKDYVNYHVILLRYDFSQISFQQFITQPELALNVLGFVPLNDIENIYENISYSISHAVNSTSSVKTNAESPAVYYQFINLADCAREVTYPSEPCKKCGRDWGVPGCTNTDKNTIAKPSRIYMDFSDCGGSGGSGGGGNPGSGGGGTISAPGTGWAPGGGYRVKYPIDLITIGDLTIDPHIVVNKYTKQLSKLVKGNWATMQIVYNNSELTVEKGYGLTLSSPTSTYTALNPALPVTNGMSSIDVSTLFDPSKTWYGKVACVIHCHLNPNVADDQERFSPPMFSVTDIIGLIAMHKHYNLVPKLKENFSVLLVTKQGTYALVLKPGVNSQNTNKLLTNQKFANEINKKLEERYSDLLPTPGSGNSMPTRDDYVQVFLKFIKDTDLSLDLYKLDYNGTQINGNLNWKGFEL